MTLKVSQINKSFSNQQVLKDVSFELKKGEILSLTGESGCGKSTLLRIISGLESLDNGQVWLDDQDITNWKPEKRKFGFVFQNLSLFPHLKVKSNIFYAEPKRDQTQEKLEELLNMTGLTGLENRYPHELSGGQQQRVAIARALAINPNILILDEPFSSLDELLKAKIRDEIFTLLRSLNITTILVSHQAVDAFLIADKLIVMKNGEIQQVGTPSQVYNEPISPYVSDFFGASVILNGSKSEENEVETSFGKLKLNTERRGAIQLFMRPENIQIGDSKDFDLKGIVLKKEFKGPHDVLKIGQDRDQEFFSLETERCPLNEGDLIYLKVLSDQIQIFD